MSIARRAVSGVWPPLAFAVLFLALWEWFVQARDVRPFVLPAPSAIWEQLKLNHDRILEAAWATGLNALVGLALGIVFGVGAALLAARVRALDEVMTPLAAAVAAIPIVALTPIFNTMFSSTSSTPRRLIVLIAVFFPVFVNTLRGLRQIDPVHAELMHSYAASPWTTTRVVRLPGALPFFFTGVRIAASAAAGLGDRVRGDRPRPRLLPRRAARGAPGDAVAPRVAVTRRSITTMKRP